VAGVVVVGIGVERASFEANEDRAFNEVDLRRMLEYAMGHRADMLAGRFVIDARHDGPAGK
jgi:hypothetical protein